MFECSQDLSSNTLSVSIGAQPKRRDLLEGSRPFCSTQTCVCKRRVAILIYATHSSRSYSTAICIMAYTRTHALPPTSGFSKEFLIRNATNLPISERELLSTKVAQS